MSNVKFPSAFLSNARGFTIADSTGVVWSFDSSTNTLSVAMTSSGVSDFNEACDDRVANLIQNGTGISWSYNDGAGTLTPTVSLASFSTTNLGEGTNLYFTDERAQDAIGTALVDSSSIDFTYNDGANTITAVVLPAGVNHNALSNYVANEHVDHTGVTLTAGAGLTGGGTIAASRTFDVGAGTGITVNANDVAVNVGATFSWTAKHTYTQSGAVYCAEYNGGTGEFAVRINNASSSGNSFGLLIAAGGNTSDGPLTCLDRTLGSTLFKVNGVGDTTVGGKLQVNGNSGFNGTTPIAKPSVTGSRGGNAALASLLTALANYGLITDSTTA